MPAEDSQPDLTYVEVPIFFGRRRWVRAVPPAPAPAIAAVAPSLGAGLELIGRQVWTAGGAIWQAEPAQDRTRPGIDRPPPSVDQLLAFFREELAARQREVQELHRLLHAAQSRYR